MISVYSYNYSFLHCNCTINSISRRCDLRLFSATYLHNSCIFVECKEYADLVYETENSPILRINAGSNKVSRCAIIETPLIIGGVPAKPAEFPHMVRLDTQ